MDERQLSFLGHWINDEETWVKDRISRGNERQAMREGHGDASTDLSRYAKLIESDYLKVEEDRSKYAAGPSKAEEDPYANPAVLTAIDSLRQEVFERSDTEHRSATAKYNRWKIYSYFLYAVGWSIGLAAKFMGIELPAGAE
jgi:hypothetical protein